MSTKNIERELAEVKQRLAKLEAATARKPSHAWREIVGMLENDELSREAARLGAEYGPGKTNESESVFVVLDTNHFRELGENSAASKNLQRQLDEQKPDVFTRIVTVEETVQGWIALVNRKPAGRDQIPSYAKLQRSVEALSKLPILPFDDEAASVFHRLRRAQVRVGTMDLKIAAICIAHDATLLTRNLVDFERVPGLRVENWLD